MLVYILFDELVFFCLQCSPSPVVNLLKSKVEPINDSVGKSAVGTAALTNRFPRLRCATDLCSDSRRDEQSLAHQAILRCPTTKYLRLRTRP
jgi:hypothetical protein